MVHEPPPDMYRTHRERPFAIFIRKHMTNFWNRFIEPLDYGLLPKTYNKNVHGPYVPWRYYGKLDTPLKDVKLGELGAWLKRRDKSPRAMYTACARKYYHWVYRFGDVRNANLSFVWQLCLLTSLLTYTLRYTSLHSIHTKVRYH